MHELYISRKENPELVFDRANSDSTNYKSFDDFLLQHVEESFEQITHVAFQERKKL